MDRLKEIYAVESYFLTKKGIELGDKRWLDKHPIYFTNYSSDIYKELVTLFRRISRLVVKRHQDTKVSVRNNKNSLVIEIKHPTVELLKGASKLPFQIRSLSMAGLPHLHRRTRTRAFYLAFVGSVCYSWCDALTLNIPTRVIQLSHGRNIPYRGFYFTAREAGSAAKIFTRRVSFIAIVDEVERYVVRLEELYTELYDLLGEDIDDIVCTKETQVSSLTSIRYLESDFNLDAFFESHCINE